MRPPHRQRLPELHPEFDLLEPRWLPVASLMHPQVGPARVEVAMDATALSPETVGGTLRSESSLISLQAESITSSARIAHRPAVLTTEFNVDDMPDDWFGPSSIHDLHGEWNAEGALTVRAFRNLKLADKMARSEGFVPSRTGDISDFKNEANPRAKLMHQPRSFHFGSATPDDDDDDNDKTDDDDHDNSLDLSDTDEDTVSSTVGAVSSDINNGPSRLQAKSLVVTTLPLIQGEPTAEAPFSYPEPNPTTEPATEPTPTHAALDPAAAEELARLTVAAFGTALDPDRSAPETALVPRVAVQ